MTAAKTIADPKAIVKVSVDAVEDEDEGWIEDTKGTDDAVDEVTINKTPQSARSLSANASATSAPDPEIWCEAYNKKNKATQWCSLCRETPVCDYCSKWSCWAYYSNEPTHWQRNKFPRN